MHALLLFSIAKKILATFIAVTTSLNLYNYEMLEKNEKRVVDRATSIMYDGDSLACLLSKVIVLLLCLLELVSP